MESAGNKGNDEYYEQNEDGSESLPSFGYSSISALNTGRLFWIISMLTQ